MASLLIDCREASLHAGVVERERALAQEEYSVTKKSITIINMFLLRLTSI